MMNKKNLQQIFANYIDRFAELNDAAHDETFKWWAAAEFRKRMDEALQAPEEEFTQALDRIKGHRKEDKVVETILESSMQPFTGLIELSKKEPAHIQKMLRELLADDGNDLDKREEKIAAFFAECKPLEKQYFPKNFRYEQTANSVSGYLFLYDPDHHYMYKAKQAKLFADCMDFYGDWGSGDQIKLKEYYKMCDELVAEIKECSALLATDQSRFHENFKYSKDDLHQDTQKHILAYDIIYCSTVYNLFEGITFKPITAKEKTLYEERLKKATELQESYVQAEERYRRLEEAIQHYMEVLVPGTPVQSRMLGEGKVLESGTDRIVVRFASNDEPKNFDFFFAIADQHLKFEDALDEAKAKEYRMFLKHHTAIYEAMPKIQKVLEEYQDILE